MSWYMRRTDAGSMHETNKTGNVQLLWKIDETCIPNRPDRPPIHNLIRVPKLQTPPKDETRNFRQLPAKSGIDAH